MAKGSGSEKTTTVPKSWAFRVRPIMAQDGDGLFDIFQREIQHNIGATLDKPKPLSDIRKMVSNVSKTPTEELLYVVAESSWVGITNKKATFQERLQVPPPCLSHNLLGSALLLPYQSKFGPDDLRSRSCFDRTATLHISVLEGSSLEGEDRRRVRGALIRGILRVCREKGLRYRTITTNMAFREDQPQLQESVYVLQEEGFRVVGMLEEVMEKNGLLLNLMMFQRNV